MTLLRTDTRVGTAQTAELTRLSQDAARSYAVVRTQLNAGQINALGKVGEQVAAAVRAGRDDGRWTSNWTALLRDVQAQRLRVSADALAQSLMKTAYDEQTELLARDQRDPLSTAGDDAQMVQLQLQQAVQRYQQLLTMMSNIMKAAHNTAMSIINNIR